MIYSFDVGFPGSINRELGSIKKYSLTGLCFGNLISPKHVITAASCILDKKAMKKSQKKVKQYIEEMRIAQVSSN